MTTKETQNLIENYKRDHSPMTPTPEQIEAAARELFDYDTRNSRNCATWETARLFYMQAAKFALTAAAGVGDTREADKAIQELRVKILSIEEYTIERCAQVAETRAARYDHQHNNQENALWQECLEIASAIRALKDKS